MCRPMQRRLLAIVSHWIFETVSAALIFMNVASIAWETQYRAKMVKKDKNVTPGDEWYFYMIECFFAFAFTVELAMRLFAKPSRFCSKKDRAWNLFDTLIVVSSVAEVFARWNAVKSKLSATAMFFLSKASILKTMRLLRLVKVVVALRKWAVFRELRIMVASLIGGMKSLMWTIIIISTSCFVFGVFFTEGAISYMVENDLQKADTTSDLRYYYGDLYDTIASLYQAITGGDSWGNTVKPLYLLPWEYTAVFYLFITFALWSLLNVVTAIFVDSTLTRSAGDREFVVQAQIEGKNEFIDQMDQIFDELDANDSGAITVEELEQHMSDPKAVAYFASLSLDVKQVKRLFHLIDIDQSGTIDRNEFIFGCLHLKGEAKNLDIAIIQHELRWIRELVFKLGEHFDNHFSTMRTGSKERWPGRSNNMSTMSLD